MRDDDRTLAHRSRRLLLNYIKSHPGVSFGEVRDVFEMNDSTLRYHLRYLERSRKVTSERVGRERHYYCEGVDKARGIGSEVSLPICICLLVSPATRICTGSNLS